MCACACFSRQVCATPQDRCVGGRFSFSGQQQWANGLPLHGLLVEAFDEPATLKLSYHSTILCLCLKHDEEVSVDEAHKRREEWEKAICSAVREEEAKNDRRAFLSVFPPVLSAEISS